MKKLFPIFILLLVILFFFRQVFLHGLLPIPSDTLIGLYHPFRDLFAQQYPRGIPFKNFLITDPIRQQFPWRELAITMEKHATLPLWNPYSFAGYPLLANFQTGALYPLNILLILLPFSLGWTLLVILQPLLAGIFLYLYLRNIRMHPLAALFGAIAFSFSGFFVAWLEWNVLLQTFLWVPLILLAKDKLINTWTYRWMLVFLFAEIASFLGGHLQIWFYAICLTNVYLFARILQKTSLQQAKNFFLQYLKNYLPFLLTGIGMFVITAVQWIPTLQFIVLSARSIDQNYLTQAGWFIPWQHLIQFLIPDFFGNPTTLNYWGVWNYGELIGYIGIAPLIFAIFAIFIRHDKKTYFYTVVCFLALLFALPTPLAQLPYMLHIPLLSTSQPTRLMGIIDLCLAVLAAIGLDACIKKRSLWMLGILAVFGFVFASLWVITSKLYLHFGITQIESSIALHNTIFPLLIFIGVGCILTLYTVFQKYIPHKAKLLIICAVLFITAIDVLRFADKFIPFTAQTYLYPSTPAIAFLQRNSGNYRFMTTDSQILPPNVSDMYHLQSIEGYDPLYLQTYAAFVAAMERNRPDISTPYGFNRIITPHDSSGPFLNLLGVKYIVSLTDIQMKGVTKVYEEGETRVYENKNVFPRAFFVSTIIPSTSQQDSIHKLFQNKNRLKTTAIVSAKVAQNNFSTAHSAVSIDLYSENTIVLRTSSLSRGFLVLTDIYYPTWHAYIDGKETKIYTTDFTFRGIVVPAGHHTIVFRDQLL